MLGLVERQMSEQEVQVLLEDVKNVNYDEFKNNPEKMKGLFLRIIEIPENEKHANLFYQLSVPCVKLHININIDHRSQFKTSELIERLQGWYDSVAGLRHTILYGKSQIMCKLIVLILVMATLATLAIAGPIQPENNEIHQVLDSVQAIESQEDETGQLETDNLIDNKIIELEKLIRQTKKDIDKKFDYQLQSNEQAINSVNTSISGASYALTIFAILVAVLGAIITLAAIILGVYTRGQVRIVTHIAKQSKTALHNHLQIRDEVRALDENIKNNMSDLYNSLKEEETKKLMERLCDVPEDIGNMGTLLASRDIPKELFPQLKKAYQSLSSDESGNESEFAITYRLQFLQHFAGLAIFDEDLQKEMEDDYHNTIAGCFRNDIKKTSEDIIKSTIKNGGLLAFPEKLKKYFVALSQSKFSNYSELYEHIYKTLLTKENRFNLCSILVQEEQLKATVDIYGRFLLAEYKDASGNTEDEKKILIDIAEPIEATEKDSGSSPDET